MVAGLFFMIAQASLSRWASGQLNLELAVAAMPLLVVLWIDCVERFALYRAARFALAASALMLVRLDMVLYLFPFLALHAALHVWLAPRPWAALRALGSTAAVATASVVALALGQVLPALAGVRS